MRAMRAMLFVGAWAALLGSASARASMDHRATGAEPASQAAVPRPADALNALPDHGVLLRYDAHRKSETRDALTFHAVQLSEAHAWQAAVSRGGIEVPLPDGSQVRFAYVRHEPGTDRNWTWFGRSDAGADAVITFGDKAVFGYIGQATDEALRLTMVNGRAWLVALDASRETGRRGASLPDDDVLLPPQLGPQRGAKPSSASAAVARGAVPAEVDVLLGYTDGLVTKYGGVSQVLTRLTNLVALGNQALQASDVAHRLRLVGTRQVSYTDTNSNTTALQALTGVVCNPTCSPQSVPVALLPLRDAREATGADLVSLVRPFRAPQQASCGLAWLLGGGGFAIDNSDAPFGYSVTSDGSDLDENSGFNVFCSDQTLSHELAHNMGQAHNLEDSNDSGTHSYSYGYREASSVGFYTIMARRLDNSSQFGINHFSNPDVTYAATGRPTGTATADNARSLDLSMPLVAQFRAAVLQPGQVFADGFEP
jgi:hypothetical protein